MGAPAPARISGEGAEGTGTRAWPLVFLFPRQWSGRLVPSPRCCGGGGSGSPTVLRSEGSTNPNFPPNCRELGSGRAKRWRKKNRSLGALSPLECVSDAAARSCGVFKPAPEDVVAPLSCGLVAFGENWPRSAGCVGHLLLKNVP